jgi:5'-methylthioadenosine phosphorylase
MQEGLIGIIGGSGLDNSLAELLTNADRIDVDTPFGKPSAKIILGTIGTKKIAFLNRHGQGHRLSPCEVPYAANIFALKKLGAHSIISSGAVGSLREQIAPGDLVVVNQFIDKTIRRQSSFFDGFAAVHCEMAQPVCSRLAKAVSNCAGDIAVKTHASGTYICMEGPQFSTQAESLMHRNWGGDLIGMTAMPEVKLAREAQICYCLISLVSDYDCWRPDETARDKQSLLKEIISNLKKATNNCLELLKAVLESDRAIIDEQCTCRKSLELAVWTDPAQIEPADKEKLKVLFI